MSPPTKRVTSIDDLPDRVITEVFKHLSPKHLAACSMVNKRWYSIYAAFRVHRLVAGSRYDRDDFTKISLKWSHPHQYIREEEWCLLMSFALLAGRPLFSNLEHLLLTGASFKIDLNKLNAFRQLVRLEIRIPFSSEPKVDLRLSRLKVLAFHRFNDCCALSIDCPELNVLVYPGEPENKGLLHVKHPGTIRVLETDMIGAQLAPFYNVECLVNKKFKAICKMTLWSLPRLRELRYNSSVKATFKSFDSAVGTADRIRQILRKFLNDVRAQRRGEFRFRYAGFQLTEMTLDQLDFGEQVLESLEEDDMVVFDEEQVCNEYVYLKNHQLIDPDDPLEFITHIDYNRLDYSLLMSCAAGEIPSGFCEKLTCVELVRVEGLPDAGRLLGFLEQLRSLRKLHLVNSELFQEFYDLLPAFARSLVNLSLQSSKSKDELQLNFDFISELPHISRIEIYDHLSFDSFRSLVKNFGKVEYVFVHFRFKGSEFNLYRCTTRHWMIYDETNARYALKTKNPDEILNFFELENISQSIQRVSVV